MVPEVLSPLRSEDALTFLELLRDVAGILIIIAIYRVARSREDPQ